MDILPATIDDLPAVCALAEEINQLHHERAPHVFAPGGGVMRDYEFWKSLIAGENEQMLIAKDGAQVTGFITLKMNPAPTIPFLLPRLICSVRTVVVGKVHQRRGIGRQLMAAAENWARQHGAAEVRLEVFAFNHSAIALYELAGYGYQSHIMTKPISI